MRQEAGLELARLAQLLGALVELGVKRDDAAIGIAQFLIELLTLLVAAANILETLQQFAIRTAIGSAEVSCFSAAVMSLTVLRVMRPARRGK